MRASRVALLPVLFAFGVLVGGSPVGQAGFLWLHLATAHHEAPRPHGEERHHDHDSTHRDPSEHHEAGRHGNGPSSGSDAREDADRSTAPGAPHEHNGVVHTHEQSPDEDPVLRADALSKFYLSPAATPVPAPAPYGSRTPWIVPAPDPFAPRIETPPPRLPG